MSTYKKVFLYICNAKKLEGSGANTSCEFTTNTNLKFADINSGYDDLYGITSLHTYLYEYISTTILNSIINLTMEILLSRVDYAHVGTTANGCIRVIHTIDASTTGLISDNSGGGTARRQSTGEGLFIGDDSQPQQRKRWRTRRKKSIGTGMSQGGETDKVVVGGQNGVLVCLERNNNDTNVVFKTQPGPAINRLELGGALGSMQDKAFTACGTEVRGYSRKGKQFLTFESNLTEPIQSLFVYGVDMLLAGRNTFYHFHDCNEKSHFFCNDQILDVLCLPVIEGGWVGRGLTPVLACADKTIKVLDGSKLAYQIPLSDAPTVLCLFCNDGGYNKQKVLFGCRNGQLGILDLGPDFFTLCQQLETKSYSTITAIHCYPMLMDSVRPDVLIGKEDGLIEVYSIDENDTLAFRQLIQCEESITSLQGGRVSNSAYPEIVVATYTGWVFALTTEPVFAAATGSDAQQKSTEEAAIMPEMEVKVQQMRMELEKLESRVRIERDRFQGELAKQEQQLQQQQPNEPNSNLTSKLAPIDFAVNDRFALQKQLGCYTLFVELAVPIDYVLLQSDVKVDLLDVERNSAVISMTETDSGSGNALLAVYRCQADITRMEMRIRSIEGQFGTLRLYIVPRLMPLTCKVRTYPIKPLALHERVHTFSESRPMNLLKLTGPFSIAEAHSWLVLCVAEVPERCPQAETVTFNFRSTFGTILQASYGKGQAIYRSDNLSTVIILRDVISRIVAMNQLKVHISCETNDESIASTLALLWPRLEHQSAVVRRLELVKGLKELEASFDDISYLNTELRQLLANYEQLHAEVESQQIYLDRILGIITDLYIDKHKMLGQNVTHRAKELLLMLQDECTLDRLVEFFNSKF